MGVNGHCEHRKFMCGSENLKMGVSGVTKLKGIEGCFEIHTLMAIPMIRKKERKRVRPESFNKATIITKHPTDPNTVFPCQNIAFSEWNTKQ